MGESEDLGAVRVRRWETEGWGGMEGGSSGQGLQDSGLL